MNTLVVCVFGILLFCGAVGCSDSTNTDPQTKDTLSDPTDSLPDDSLSSDTLVKLYSRARAGFDYPIYSIAMFNNSQGFVGSKNNIWLSTLDGGRKWEYHYETGVLMTNFYCVDFISSKNGYFAGGYGGLAGLNFMHLVDGKPRWFYQPDVTGISVRAISFASDSTAVIATDGGGVYLTNNAGKDWRRLGERADVYGITALNDSTFWSVGRYGSVVGTRNAGGTFTTVSKAEIGKPTLYSVAFAPNKRDGWIVGDHTIMYTVDAGDTWTTLQTDANLRYVKSNGRMAYAVGEKGVLMISSDVKTWRSTPTGTTKNLYGLDCRDSLWIVGDGGTILTSMPPQ